MMSSSDRVLIFVGFTILVLLIVFVVALMDTPPKINCGPDYCTRNGFIVDPNGDYSHANDAFR